MYKILKYEVLSLQIGWRRSRASWRRDGLGLSYFNIFNKVVLKFVKYRISVQKSRETNVSGMETNVSGLP